MGKLFIPHRLPSQMALESVFRDVETLLLPQPTGALFRGDLLSLATQGSLADKRLLASPEQPAKEFAYVLQGGLYTYVRHSRMGIHAGKRVVLDLHPPGSFLTPPAYAGRQQLALFTEALGDTELLFFSVADLLALCQQHPQASLLLQRIGQWQQGCQQDRHAGLSYTDTLGKLRWMKTRYPYFYRYLSNQCLGSFLGMDMDTARKNRYGV